MIYYNPRLKQLARQLRKQSTLAEVLLWRKLKGKQLRGYDFHRQKPIDEYIVDFFCPRLALIVEIDGISHEGKFELDEKRSERLASLGLSIIRFRENEVRRNMEGVLSAIEDWIETREKMLTLSPKEESGECIRHTPKSPLARGDFEGIPS